MECFEMGIFAFELGCPFLFLVLPRVWCPELGASSCDFASKIKTIVRGRELDIPIVPPSYASANAGVENLFMQQPDSY